MRLLLTTLLPLLILLCAWAAFAKKPSFEPVGDFQLQRYLGTWYEIARMPVWFENGLIGVTATYTLRDDGKVAVLNQGIRERDGTCTAARGRARFASRPDIGWLRVSFFGPFYADYIIVELDKEGYRYALVAGSKTRYLWILSREPRLDKEIIDRLVQTAAGLGFDTSRLYFTPHQGTHP